MNCSVRILPLVLLLAGCGPEKVLVPDSKPPIQPPPAQAMQPCPTAEREGTGSGMFPDLEDGSRGAVVRAATEGARYLRVCDERHRALREAIDSYLEDQRPPQDR